MRPADTWKDYELLDATDGNRLERWGETLLIRPDPQVVWKTPKQSPLWAKADAIYHRSNQGGGEWEYRRRLPEKWKISCGEGEDKLTLIVSPTGFKHTGVFPEQAVNWAWYQQKIRAANRPVKVLNLFGYTGGATLACAAAGATVCHVDASKGIVAWGKDNAVASSLTDKPIRWLVDDCAKFVAREKRRGNTYDGIIMDPPSYGRGPGGETGSWRIASTTSSASVKRCSAIPRCSLRSTATPPVCPRQSWSICSRPRWCPALAEKPAATRSVCRCLPPAAWCPAAPPRFGKNESKILSQSRRQP